jgi:hypothetical protein
LGPKNTDYDPVNEKKTGQDLKNLILRVNEELGTYA